MTRWQPENAKPSSIERPIATNGMDRTRVRDGLVCENYIFFDSNEFQQLVGA